MRSPQSPGGGLQAGAAALSPIERPPFSFTERYFRTPAKQAFATRPDFPSRHFGRGWESHMDILNESKLRVFLEYLGRGASPVDGVHWIEQALFTAFAATRRCVGQQRFAFTAPRQMRSSSSGNEIPAAFAACGGSFVAVMPGSEFASGRTTIFPSGSRLKSTGCRRPASGRCARAPRIAAVPAPLKLGCRPGKLSRAPPAWYFDW